MKTVLSDISVVIPCYPPDINVMIDRTIPSFLNSRHDPLEIIIALSETSNDDAQKIQEQLLKDYNLNIIVHPCEEQQYAGENRNRGASIAKGEIIVFINTDDEIHPQKLEITEKIFTEYKPQMLLHHWLSYSRKFQEYDLNELNIIDSDTISDYTLSKNEKPNYLFVNCYGEDERMPDKHHPHHGYVAIHKSVLKDIQYSTKPSGEDVEFCLKVLQKYNKTIYVDAKLVNYMHMKEDKKVIVEPVIKWWDADFKIEVKNIKNKSNKKSAIVMLDAFSVENFKQYSENYNVLSKSTVDEIWKHYPVMGKKYKANENLIRKAGVIEPFLLFNYFKENDTDFRVWYNNSLFILNDSLYRITNNKVYKEDLNDIFIVSLRESWSHPFFGFLEILLKKSNGKLTKPNMKTLENVGCMNKLFGLKELYLHRDEYIQDIVIPYNLAPHHHEVFIRFLKENIGNELVIKIDCIQEGRGVIFENVENSLKLDSISPVLNKHKKKSKEIFITPAFDIKEEFRCYFTKNEQMEIEVFSIKQRINKSSKEDMFKAENLHIYKNIEVSWREIKEESDDFDKASKIAHKMINIMSYTSGSIEFGITSEKKIVFFEVNQMAGPLPFIGKDLENMNRYYKTIFDDMFKV